MATTHHQHRHLPSREPPTTCTGWLGVAFWKKPLHLILTSEHGGHHQPQQQQQHATNSSPSSSSSDTSSASPSPTSPPQEIERTLGLFDLTMIGIGGTVGAGVFATAGLIANVYAGPAAVLSWLIAGVGCLLSGLSFMELSCLIPSAGSTYAYAYHALGELPAMFAGFLLTLEYGVSSAGGARSWSDKFTNWLATQWGVTGPKWMKPGDGSTVDLYAGLLMALCVSVVLAGMQAGKVLVNVVTMTKICVVLFIICVGFSQFDSANITPFVPPQQVVDDGTLAFGWPGVFLGASASFFGYIGYDEVCCLAGEAKNPTRNIPRAVVGTIVGAAVLSTLATFALVGMQRHTQIDTEESFGKAFESNGLHWAASIVTTGEVLTMPITTLIGFMAQPRVQYAMARDGLLPQVFAKLDKNGNLFYGTLVCGVCAIAVATFVPFRILWDFISLGILVAFNLTNASLLLVRGEQVLEGQYDDTQVDQHEHQAKTKQQKSYGVLLVVYCFSSFVAAYHWQKSIITPPPPPNDQTSYFHLYLASYGAFVAVLASFVALGAMGGLHYVLSNGSSNTTTASSTTASIHKTKTHTQDDSEEIILSSHHHRSDQLELGPLRREKNHTTVLSVDSATETETEAETDSLSSHSHSHSLRRRLSDPSASEDEDTTAVPAGLELNLLPDGDTDQDDQDDNNGKPHDTFRAPLVPFFPCVAIFFNWFLFAQMEFASVLLILLWLLLALAVYVSYSVHHSLARQQLRYHAVDVQETGTQ